MPVDHRVLRDSIEAANKRWDALTLEQQAAETAEQEKDEAELLDWYENRGGKDQKLHPMVEAELRVIRAKRNPPADNSPTPREQYEALSVAKPAEPIPAEVKQEQPEPLPVVEIQSSKAYVSVSDTPGTLEDINKREEAYRAAHPIGIGGGWGT